MATLKFTDLDMALEYVSAGDIFSTCAYISRDNGEIYWQSDDSGPGQVLPDNLDDTSLYAAVPGKRDLDLGKGLVMDFVGRNVLEDYEKVENMFRRKGAYSKYKKFLYAKDLIESWYKFEAAARKKAIIGWAESEGFKVDVDDVEIAG